MLNILRGSSARLFLRHRHLRSPANHWINGSSSRDIVTLAIESSCDDTSVAVLERCNGDQASVDASATAKLHFHERVTANNTAYGGVHPIVSLESHQSNISKLVAAAIEHLPQRNPAQGRGNEEKSSAGDDVWRRRPDFISVTRGPGMRSSLSVGLDVAKGLSLAWQIPMVGVHHMHAHALTPRLDMALSGSIEPSRCDFPFLSLLVSGGHSLLLRSDSLTENIICASTNDTAIGDAIDKMARDILPDSELRKTNSVSFGPLLERFAFPNEDPSDYGYIAPWNLKDSLMQKETRWGWAFKPPFSQSSHGSKRNAMEFSFGSLATQAKKFVEDASLCAQNDSKVEQDLELEQRKDLAREGMRVAFEQLAHRTILGLRELNCEARDPSKHIQALVLSGGVAANKYLRHIIRSYLDVHGFEKVKLLYPSPELCTDNAAMIGWAGIEMYNAGWETTLDCEPLRKWSLDSSESDGGLFGVASWRRRDR